MYASTLLYIRCSSALTF